MNWAPSAVKCLALSGAQYIQTIIIAIYLIYRKHPCYGQAANSAVSKRLLFPLSIFALSARFLHSLSTPSSPYIHHTILSHNREGVSSLSEAHGHLGLLFSVAAGMREGHASVSLGHMIKKYQEIWE